MNRCSSFHHALVVAGLALVPCASFASSSSDLDTLPLRPVCNKVFRTIGGVVESRDQGASKASILERNRTGREDDALSESLIDSVFAYPRVTGPALTAYALWTCHANSYGLEVLPLAAVHAELTTCAAPPAGEACLRVVRDRVLGISRKYVADRPLTTPDMLELRLTPTTKAPPQDATTRVPIAGSCEKPRYSRESLIGKETGSVTVRLLIDAQGAVLDGKIAKSSGFERLDQEVLTTMSLCKYAPLIKDGKPDSGFIRAGHTFTLE